jgi:hypothetical protein
MRIRRRNLKSRDVLFICSRTVGKWSGHAPTRVSQTARIGPSQPCLRYTKTSDALARKIGAKGMRPNTSAVTRLSTVP